MTAKKKPTLTQRVGKSVAHSAGKDVSGFWMAILAAISGGLYAWIQSHGTKNGFVFWIAYQGDSFWPGELGSDAYGLTAAVVAPLLVVLKKYYPRLVAALRKIVPKPGKSK